MNSIKNILAHPEDKNLAIDLFERSHIHISHHGNWFVTKDRFIKFRHKFGFVFVLSLILLSLCTLFLGVIELVSPGITQSGIYAAYSYPILFCVLILVSYMTLQDLASLGGALQLVYKLRP